MFFLDILNTGIQDIENSKPVFDPVFHTKLIIKDEYEDFNSGIAETYILTIINIHELEIIYYNYKVFDNTSICSALSSSGKSI